MDPVKVTPKGDRSSDLHGAVHSHASENPTSIKTMRTVTPERCERQRGLQSVQKNRTTSVVGEVVRKDGRIYGRNSKHLTLKTSISK